jgi:aminopeptidase YwaD
MTAQLIARRIRRSAGPRALTCLSFALCAPTIAAAQQPPLLAEPIVAALAQELSGENALRVVEALALQHRMRGSAGFRAAAEHIVTQLRSYGFEDAHIESFPADGRIFYGTQRSRPAWDAEFAELWELRESAGTWQRAVRLASWDAAPVSLAQDSESADVVADLVAVGEGTAADDYEGRDVRGRIVLAAAQPGAVARLAVERYGAAGIISYAQNQRSAWWGENANLVRWGHLDTFAPSSTFGFMISPNQARALQQRLARGERIRLHAIVRAGQRSGAYDVVMATIPGGDPQLAGEEIAFSCHLDHQRPGANDNASGCATILEVARALHKLIAEQRIPRPARTLRFIWPPEIEGTLALLNARPDIAARIRAVVHMDMVGGGPETKAVFHVTRGPGSLPSFVHDVAAAFADFVNEQSYEYAATGSARYPLVSREGGREPLLARHAEFSMGSDHQIYTESSFGIPAIYLNDWPDRYIHTNLDRPDNLDATKLLRAAFIGGASGYFLAAASAAHAEAVRRVVRTASLGRTVTMLARRDALPADEAGHLTRFHLDYERGVLASMDGLLATPPEVRAAAAAHLGHIERLVGAPAAAQPPRVSVPAGGRTVYRRNPEVRGPTSGFGYDYLADHYGEDRAAALRLARFSGARAGGSAYVYEVLNLVDGRRSVYDIRNVVSAIYGPVPLEYVAEYLEALHEIGLVALARAERAAYLLRSSPP